MSSNPMPWLILASIVLAALFLKGHIRLPALKPAPVRDFAPSCSTVNTPQGAPAIGDLDQYPAWQLGIAFAKAAKREAENGLHHSIASKHLDEMMATFQSPFAAPTAPPAAGPPLNQAGANHP